MALDDMINTLVDLGVMDVLIPFLLVFTIVFAVAQKSKIFGDDKKNFNVIIALVMALAVVIPHVSVVLVAVVMLLLMVGIWGAEIKWAGGSPAGWVVIVSGVIVFAIFGQSAGWFGGDNSPEWLSFLWSEDIKSLLVIILVFGII